MCDTPSVLVLVHDLHIRVLTRHGELLRELTLDPTRDYQPRAAKKGPNQHRKEHDVPRQV